jgi:hypothetical protein
MSSRISFDVVEALAARETGKKLGGRIIDRPFDLEQCNETDGMTRSGDGLAL